MSPESGVPLDPAIVSELRQVSVGNDAESKTLYDEISRLFLIHSPQVLSRLKSALERQDRRALSREAHSLKSSAATLGATTLSRSCAELEKEGAGELPAKALEAMLKSIEFQYLEVERALLQSGGEAR